MGTRFHARIGNARHLGGEMLALFDQGFSVNES